MRQYLFITCTINALKTANKRVTRECLYNGCDCKQGNDETAAGERRRDSSYIDLGNSGFFRTEKRPLGLSDRLLFCAKVARVGKSLESRLCFKVADAPKSKVAHVSESLESESRSKVEESLELLESIRYRFRMSSAL